MTIAAGAWNARDLLTRLKKELPFLLRYDTKHGDYKNLQLAVPATGMTATELLTLITKALPGWQSTRFPGHMILYKEQREYTFGTVIWYQPPNEKASSS